MDARSMTPKPPDDDPRYADETLLDGKATRQRYSPKDGPIKSPMWLKRRGPNFPRPIFIGIHPHYRLGQLRRWEDGLSNTPPPAQLALGAQGVEVLKEARAKKKAEAAPATVGKRKPKFTKPRVAAV
jgi:hypothetical protein